jgi:release factor glutamine methyltransferase
MSLFTLGARLAADARRLAATVKISRGDAMREIRRLATHALQLTPAQLIVRERESPGRFDLSAYGIVFDRRLRGEPLPYVLGEWPFRDHVFKVTQDVLIPRPDTEVLVEAALGACPEGRSARILDLGTGSGCIAISIALARPAALVTGVDASPEALAVARENAERLGASNASLLESDWYRALAGQTFEVIVSNPPYVAEGDPHLDALKFEPVRALVGGADGLEALRVVISAAPGHLDPGGTLVVEHGYDQRDAVCQLFAAAGFQSVETANDLSGVPRIVVGRMARKVPEKVRRKGAAVSA